MNKILVLIGIAIAAVALWLLLSREAPRAASTGAPATSGSATATGSSASSAPPPVTTTPIDKVGRVSPEERRRLAEQIANAKAKRAAPSSGGGASPTTPRPELAESDAKLVRTTLADAMHDILEHLGDCYEKAGDKLPATIKVVGNMTLTGDPDVGTIIDTNDLADGDGKPLEPGFDLCLRDAFVSLQIPPLSEGGEVKVTYPFVFSR